MLELEKLIRDNYTYREAEKILKFLDENKLFSLIQNKLEGIKEPS